MALILERCEPWSDYFDGARAHYQFRQNLYKFHSGMLDLLLSSIEITFYLGSNDNIRLLPFTLLKELAQSLDVPRQSSNDYRSLAGHFLYRCEDVDHLGVEHMKRHGSPFLRLVGELATRSVTVGDLIEALRTIDHPELVEKVAKHVDVSHNNNPNASILS